MRTVTGQRLIWRAGLLAVWAAFALYGVLGAGTVPFHPDESTHLYMSRDFDLLFLQGQPSAVTWRAPGHPPLVQRYRLLDAPLSRYLAGLGRALAGEPPLAEDWDWSASWEANVAAGALPDPRTLAAARLPATVLTVLSSLLVYSIGHRLGGRAVGLSAAVLFALSGLVLLHGRRAMAEGPLLFFTLLTFWLALRDRPRPLALGLALAAAVAAKLTAVALLPVAVVALLPSPAGWCGPAVLRQALSRLAVFACTCLLGLWALHPALWASPVAGLQAMAAARQAFLNEQSAFVQSVAPHVLLGQPGLRPLALLYHVFFAPLAYADVGQYAAATAAAEQRYAAVALNPGWHTPSLTANFVIGGLALALALVGLLQSLLGLRAASYKPATAPFRGHFLSMVWTMSTIGVLFTIAVPAQRYYLPMVPMACLWASLGLAALARPFRSASRRTRTAPIPAYD